MDEELRGGGSPRCKPEDLLSPPTQEAAGADVVQAAVEVEQPAVASRRGVSVGLAKLKQELQEKNPELRGLELTRAAAGAWKAMDMHQRAAYMEE